MTTTLADWDEKVRPHLHGIESGAEMCTRHVGQLVYRPTFETLAFEDIQKLERLLSTALDKVRAAKRAYRELPPGD
jgi:hypothetical protein